MIANIVPVFRPEIASDYEAFIFSDDYLPEPQPVVDPAWEQLALALEMA